MRLKQLKKHVMWWINNVYYYLYRGYICSCHEQFVRAVANLFVSWYLWATVGNSIASRIQVHSNHVDLKLGRSQYIVYVFTARGVISPPTSQNYRLIVTGLTLHNYMLGLDGLIVINHIWTTKIVFY